MEVSDNQVFISGYTAASPSPVWSARKIISQHYVLSNVLLRASVRWQSPVTRLKS